MPLGAKLVLLALVALLGWAIALDLAHPCVQTKAEQTTCGGALLCATFDGTGNCLVWFTEPEYACTVERCVERAP